MKKTTHTQQLLLVILSLVVVAVVFSFGTKKAAEKVDIVETPITEDTNKAPWPSAEIKKEFSDQSDSKRKVSAYYPVTNSESVNAYFKQYVDEQMRQFKDDTSWVEDPEIDSAAESVLSLEIDYSFEASDKAHNYIFTTYAYTGGAHGLSATKTFAFSQDGKLIQLADLFTNGLNGLKTVAPRVKSELMKEELTNKEWVEEGAAPTADNYKSFIITNNGIRFAFDPYHVAAYAAGLKTVEVPVSVFRSVANKDYFTL